MGLPNIHIAFKTQGVSAVQRSQKGVVALIVKGTGSERKLHTLTSATNLPSSLLNKKENEIMTNQKYIENAFLGYVNKPSKVLVYEMAASDNNFDDALKVLSTHSFDYLAGPQTLGMSGESLQASVLANWIETQRNNHRTVKAVLPNYAANSDGVINFATEGIVVHAPTSDDPDHRDTFNAGQYCSRIAGLLAGTPMNISCTYAPLSEVEDITRLSQTDMDKAINKGEFILMHDGRKVKVGRGINSLTTTVEGHGEEFKKIKIVEAVDMIQNDIRMTAQDNYIGKYANSYDNKCLLITAIKGYFTQLEQEGILDPGKSIVDIDIDAQSAYLQSTGVDVSELSEQELRNANTKDKVFLAASIKILDAIEDIDLQIAI